MILASLVALIISMSHSSNMKHIGVIGLGNPLRRDDGIGIILLKKLYDRRHELPESIQYIDEGTGGMNILHTLVRFDIVFIIDAVNFNAKPGEGKLFTLDEIKTNRTWTSSSSHGADILEVISLSKKLDEAPERIVFFGIQPKDTSMGEGLSTEVSQCTNQLLVMLIGELTRICEESS